MWLRSLIVMTTVVLIYLGYLFGFAAKAPPTKANTSSSIPRSAVLISMIPTFTESAVKSFKTEQNSLEFALKPQILTAIESIIHYADANQIEHNQILTLIDYSLPADQKRLWVFDLTTHTILFHTYVSHGLTSGSLKSLFFSNRFNSKASSIGVYRTNKTYYGRHGLSLKLDGLDRGFNDNADQRAVVMHGGWYVEEAFIHKYGRAGRSWGCPAVPDLLTSPIINTIKDNSLLIIYYPSSEWFIKSPFLKDHPKEALIEPLEQITLNQVLAAEKREDVMLGQVSKQHKNQENDAILAMPADYYLTLFKGRIPLERMIRRQIEGKEYIALSKTEVDQLINNKSNTSQSFQEIYLIVPEIKMIRGYYATEMRKINLGSILNIEAKSTSHDDQEGNYIIQCSNHPSIALKTTHRFIRWLGL